MHKESPSNGETWARWDIDKSTFPPCSSGLKRTSQNSLRWKYCPRGSSKIGLPYRILRTLIPLWKWSFNSVLVTLNHWIILCKASRASLIKKTESVHFSFLARNLPVIYSLIMEEKAILNISDTEWRWWFLRLLFLYTVTGWLANKIIKLHINQFPHGKGVGNQTIFFPETSEDYQD